MRRKTVYSVACLCFLTLSILSSELSASYLHLGRALAEDSSNSASSGWLTGWQYRKSHLVNSASGAGTDYCLKITAYYDATILLSASNAPDASISTTGYLGENIVYDNATAKYWWVFEDRSNPYIVRVAWATSIDGPWTIQSTPVISEAGRYCMSPCIAQFGSYWYIYYGRADGLSTEACDIWVRQSSYVNQSYSASGIDNPILARGSSTTAWDHLRAYEPYIYFEDNTYYLFYMGQNGTTNSGDSSNFEKTGYATSSSPTGVFTKYSANPILPADNWPHGIDAGSDIAADPFIFKYGDTYYIGVTACSSGHGSTPWQICFYTSRDLVSFTWYGSNPVLGVGSSGAWDEDGAFRGAVESFNGSYYLSYAGFDGTDFRCGLTNFTLSRTEGGNQVFLNGHCRRDFGDIRFTASDGITLLNYYMENDTALPGYSGAYADFWVQDPDNLDATNSTIYIYYGNPTATTTSDGTKTFLFFDDFYNLSAWTTVYGSWVASASILNGTGSTGVQARIKSSFSDSGGMAYELMMRPTQSGSYNWAGIEIKSPVTNYGGSGGYDQGYLCLAYGRTNNRVKVWRCNSGSLSLLSDVPQNLDVNKWLKFRVTYYDNTIETYVNGGLGASATDSAYTTGSVIRIFSNDQNLKWQYDYVFVRKFVDPEPSHGAWGAETLSSLVVIDETFVTDARADVGTSQTVGIHALWENNGSDVVAGTLYANGTGYITNNTGWANLIVTSSAVGYVSWSITGVNCNGISTYVQTASPPSIIWDQIEISEGGVTNHSPTLGETTTIWFKTLYEYDDQVFNGTKGALYINGSPATWSTTDNRWEYSWVPTTTGTTSYTVSGVSDTLYGLTSIDDKAGPQTVAVWSSPFSIASNSTVTQFAFGSTNLTMSFTVSGPSGTTGYTNVTIAKTLVTDITEITVYLDGNQIEFTNSSTQFYWLLSFTYSHSTHRVIIAMKSLEQTPQAFDYGNLLLIVSFLCSLLTGSLIIWKRHFRRETISKER